MKHYSKSQRIVALIGVLFLIALYLGTFIVSLLDFEGSDRLFQACLVATVGIPILLWIYIWIFQKWKDHDSISPPK